MRISKPQEASKPTVVSGQSSQKRSRSEHSRKKHRESQDSSHGGDIVASTLQSQPSASVTATAATTSTAAPCKNALLIIGTYHSVMAGLLFKKGNFFLKFSVKRHVGCLHQTAASGRYIASSGVDERVMLFTNKAADEHRCSAAVRQKMKDLGEPVALRLADLGSLAPPSEVTCLTFVEGSAQLLCGCANGELLLYRCRDWALMLQLPVHEKSMIAFALHPSSRGRLLVSLGDDRSVAVLDLSRGKLLTKWKYTSHGTGAATTPEAESEMKAAAPRPKESPSRVAVAPEVPLGIHFSPSGRRFVIFARFSCVVYDAELMLPTFVYRCSTPQPPEELQCCMFVTEDQLLFGNESGELRVVTVEGTTAAPQCQVGHLSIVQLQYSDAVAKELAAARATSTPSATIGRLKRPPCHVARLKVLQMEGSTLFSIDSSGIVIAWEVEQQGAAVSPSMEEMQSKKKKINASAATPAAAAPLTLRYISSANCQGRATSMSIYNM